MRETFASLMRRPLNTFALIPSTCLFGPILHLVDPISMLFSKVPLTIVFSSIWPLEMSLTISFVISELTCIFFAVRPFEVSLSVHFVIDPFALVQFSVNPLVDSKAADLVHPEDTFVDRTISKDQLAFSVFLSRIVFALICCTILPGFTAVSMLLIV